MTIRRRLARSNLVMILIPVAIAAVLLLAGGVLAVLLLKRVYLPRLGLSMAALHETGEQLDTLVSGVKRIRDGDLDTPIGYEADDEFKPACAAVDEMAARLKASLEAQSRSAFGYRGQL